MEILKLIRAPFAWKPAEFFPVRKWAVPVEIQQNTVTGRYRWCHVTPPRSVPDAWKPGVPPVDLERIAGASGGSGVKPAARARDAEVDDLLAKIREVLPEGLRGKLDESPTTDRFADIRKAMAEANKSGKLLLDAGEKAEPPPRRLQLSAAAKGGYMVGEPYDSMGRQFFRTVYAGDLSDCLNFMESEMESASC